MKLVLRILVNHNEIKWFVFSSIMGVLIGAMTFLVLLVASEGNVVSCFCTAWFLGTFAYVSGQVASNCVGLKRGKSLFGNRIAVASVSSAFL